MPKHKCLGRPATPIMHASMVHLLSLTNNIFEHLSQYLKSSLHFFQNKPPKNGEIDSESVNIEMKDAVFLIIILRRGDLFLSQDPLLLIC